ncbi:MAG: cysteine desulfurase [Firmicutes bacterium]|nr:cysteine desulfurase [Bacillota bacterium]
MKEIYFDNAATTRIRPEVLSAMNDAEGGLFYNSSAMYAGSVKSRKAIEQAGDIVLSRLTKRKTGNVIFTSGATEGNNIVIFGKMTNPRQHMVVLAGEHSSTYAPSVYLKNNGYEVDYIPLKKNGVADLDTLTRLIRPNTALIVFGYVNSDTGVIQPTADIVKIVKSINPKAHVHCDVVQGFCKFDFDVMDLGLDSVVVSAHKIYGPKGVGALWLKKGTTLKPIMYGGSQQEYRPGTENNSDIIGLAQAIKHFDTQSSYMHVKKLQDRLLSGLPRGCSINGDASNPYITNIMLPNVFGHTVMNALSSRGIYVGLGSACSSKAAKNRTLIAMGIPENKTKNVIRVSFGIYNTLDEVDIFLDELENILKSY